MIYTSYLDAMIRPSLVYPNPSEAPNLVAAVFEYMKRVPAQFCLERALSPVSRQVLAPDGVYRSITAESSLVAERPGSRVFIETSSGNMATGLAEVCRQKGVLVHLLMPSSVDEPTKRYIRELGAIVDEIPTSDQKLRLERLSQIKADYEARGFEVTWVAQYENRNNPVAYWTFAELLASELDRIDLLVGPVGTGGSSLGTATYLRGSGFPQLKLVGVDACGSVNFDHAHTPFLMGGLGSTRPMKNVVPDEYDFVHWVDDTTAFATALALFDNGIPVGGSSGAAYVAARYEADRHPDQTVVVILPDHARRYEDAFRSPDWRAIHGIDLSQACSAPIEVDEPAESDPSVAGVVPAWYRIDWRAYRSRGR
jgi:cysteine synthase A